MSSLSVLAVLVLVVGVGGLALAAAPSGRWESAMDRLHVRIRQDLATRGHDSVPAGTAGTSEASRAELPGAVPGSRAGAPTSFVDRSIDRFIDVLRSTIGTRAFPRAVALVVGAVLVLVAILLFALSPSGGGGGESNDEGLGGNRSSITVPIRRAAPVGSSTPAVQLREV